MSETILEKSEGRVSYHDSVEEMLKRIREDGMSKSVSGDVTARKRNGLGLTI